MYYDDGLYILCRILLNFVASVFYYFYRYIYTFFHRFSNFYLIQAFQLADRLHRRTLHAAASNTSLPFSDSDFKSAPEGLALESLARVLER